MAFIKSKKLYAILMSSEEGKDIVQDAPGLSEEELQKRIDTFMGKSGGGKGSTLRNREDIEEGNNQEKSKKLIERLNFLDKWSSYKNDEGLDEYKFEHSKDFEDATNELDLYDINYSGDKSSNTITIHNKESKLPTSVANRNAVIDENYENYKKSLGNKTIDKIRENIKNGKYGDNYETLDILTDLWNDEKLSDDDYYQLKSELNVPTRAEMREYLRNHPEGQKEVEDLYNKYPTHKVDMIRSIFEKYAKNNKRK